MHRKTYKITVWKRWDYDVCSAVEDFYSRTKVYPNVLLANPTTFAKINLIAAKSMIASGSRIGKSSGETPDGVEYVDLTGFVGDGYELRFAENKKLADTAFALLFDSDPDGGGEPWPEHDTVKNQTKKTG